jgi:hypothetical protein
MYSPLSGTNCTSPYLIALVTSCIMCLLFSSCLGITLAVDKGFEGCEGANDTITIEQSRICNNTEDIETCKATESCNWRASFLSIIMGDESAESELVQCTDMNDCVNPPTGPVFIGGELAPNCVNNVCSVEPGR